jgi:hypothetical protein
MIVTRAIRSLTLISSATLRHLHDISRNLHLCDTIGPFLAGIYENIGILTIYGVVDECQFFSVPASRNFSFVVRGAASSRYVT